MMGCVQNGWSARREIRDLSRSSPEKASISSTDLKDMDSLLSSSQHIWTPHECICCICQQLVKLGGPFQPPLIFLLGFSPFIATNSSSLSSLDAITRRYFPIDGNPTGSSSSFQTTAKTDLWKQLFQGPHADWWPQIGAEISHHLSATIQRFSNIFKQTPCLSKSLGKHFLPPRKHRATGITAGKTR